MPSNTNDETIVTDEMLRSVQLRLLGKVRQLAPQHLAPFLTTDNVTIEKRGDGGYSILMRLIPKEGLTDDARAQEFGSGLHATRKGFHSKNQQPDGRIKIVPHSPKTLLIFYWDKIDKKVAVPSVMHPGIKPYKGRGYMREALVQSKDRIAEELGKEAADNLRLKVRAIFSRPGGKNK